jgi:hypothetical protein
MSLLLKLLLFIIIGGTLLIHLFLLLDSISNKLPKDHSFRKWWEKHICYHIEEDDDYDIN